MINFTVGPVQMNDEIREIGSQEIPYFRTDEFSKIMLENEKMICELVKAKTNDRAVVLTSSGTGGMEATIINIFNKRDKVLIINGGSFGERFVEICKEYDIPYINIELEKGKILKKEILELNYDKKITGVLVNAHETSTNVLYDLKMIGEFCEEKKIYFVVDAISSFLADEIKFNEFKIDAMIISSQKALALPPGIAIIVLAQRIIEKIFKNKNKVFYFNLKKALIDGERGQTPYTPAVSIILQLNKRLRILKKDGISKEQEKIKKLAEDFRRQIVDLPFKFYSENMSNAETAISPLNVSAYKIFEILKNEYGIWVCPNSGELKDKILRVGHIGNLTVEDNNKLIEALKDMEKRRLL